MAMDSKHNGLAYHHKLFFLLILFSWTLAGGCLIFQHKRETYFKAEQLNMRLQLFNRQLTDALHEGIRPETFMANTELPFSDLRVSIIDRSGHVAFDNTLDSLPSSNHLTRKEITDAMANGTGYAVRRHSQSNDETYFYSALSDNGIIVRSAVPYSTVSIAELLDADKGFIWFVSELTLLLSVAAYFATRRLGHNITRLNNFARKAEQGERIWADEPFPNDELGEISSHIIRLYARMQQVVAERDRQHRLALHEEQEKIRIKKQLTNNINHELKTPVAAIQVCLETLLTHPDLPEEKRMDFLHKCLTNSERLCALLNDVATITRMDDGGTLITMEWLNLSTLVRTVLTDTPANGFTVYCTLPDELDIYGNADMLSSVFRNLTDNAVAYSDGNRIDIELIDNTERYYRIRFADNGTGVDEKHLPHLFERFYRIDKGRSRRLGGTGLGLAIVKNAILMHGGNISVANRPEGGLAFEFTLRKQDGEGN